MFFSRFWTLLRNSQQERYQENNISVATGERNSKFGSLTPLGFPIEGGIPSKRKGMPVCNNPMYVKSDYIEKQGILGFCWGYALNHFLCIITSSDRGIPFLYSTK